MKPKTLAQAHSLPHSFTFCIEYKEEKERKHSLFLRSEMTQGKRRSKGCRSFLTCDDPKGVAEYGTVRVCRVGSKKRDQDKVEHRRKHKDLSTLLAEEREEEKEEMGISRIGDGELLNPNCFQLMQVSNRAHKIDQRAKEASRDSRSKDITNDLLKGALGLQESLVALRRLQEAPNAAPSLDIKRKKELQRGGFDGGDDKYVVGFERRGSSCDEDRSIEELKKVIRESLVKQNVAPSSVGTEESYIHCIRLDSSPSNVPSTSSSQATTTNSSSFNSSDSSLSSTASKKSTERPNLVAKLMGLESLPSSSRRQMSSGKLSNLKKPLFDIDLPMLRQPQFLAQRVDGNDEAVHGVLETVRLRGLLKRSAVDGASPRSHHSWTDDSPPIVVIKPLPVSCPSMEDTAIPRPPQNGAGNEKALVRPKSRREPALGTVKSDPSLPIDNRREVEVNVSPAKSRYQGGIHRKQVKDKTEGTAATAKDKRSLSPKKSAACALEEPLKHPVGEKRDIEVHKTAAAMQKGVEKKTIKSENETRSQASTNVRGSKLKKPENGVQKTRGRISVQQSTNNGSNNVKCIRQGSEKTVMKRAASTGDQGSKGANIDFECTCEDKLIARVAKTSEGEQFNGEQPRTRDKKGDNHEDTTNHQTDTQDSFYEIILTEHEGGTNDHSNKRPTSSYSSSEDLKKEDNLGQLMDDGLSSTKEAETWPNCIDNLVRVESCHAKEKLMDLLLSSPSFISRAEELFDLKMDLNRMMPPTSTNPTPDASISNALVGYAIQFLELKSQQYAQASLPLRHDLINIHLKNTFSMDEILEETCDVIKTLSCYSNKPSLQTISVDALSTLLDRDMKYAGIRDGMWDIGWRNGFSEDEVERIALEMEKLVLAGLVQETLEDFRL